MESCAHPERVDGICTRCDDCLHEAVIEGVCARCGQCLHDVILNGACYFCGATELDPVALSPWPPAPLVPADRLRRRPGPR